MLKKFCISLFCCFKQDDEQLEAIEMQPTATNTNNEVQNYQAEQPPATDVNIVAQVNQEEQPQSTQTEITEEISTKKVQTPQLHVSPGLGAEGSSTQGSQAVKNLPSQSDAKKLDALFNRGQDKQDRLVKVSGTAYLTDPVFDRDQDDDKSYENYDPNKQI